MTSLLTALAIIAVGAFVSVDVVAGTSCTSATTGYSVVLTPSGNPAAIAGAVAAIGSNAAVTGGMISAITLTYTTGTAFLAADGVASVISSAPASFVVGSYFTLPASTAVLTGTASGQTSAATSPASVITQTSPIPCTASVLGGSFGLTNTVTIIIQPVCFQSNGGATVASTCGVVVAGPPCTGNTIPAPTLLAITVTCPAYAVWAEMITMGVTAPVVTGTTVAGSLGSAGAAGSAACLAAAKIACGSGAAAIAPSVLALAASIAMLMVAK